MSQQPDETIANVEGLGRIQASESEIEYISTIAAIDQAMKEEQDEVRGLILAGLPLDEILKALNIEGDITPDTIAEAEGVISAWVQVAILPRILGQERFYLGGQVVDQAGRDLA